MTSKKVTPEQLVERFEKELEGWRDEHSSLLPTEKLKNFTELALGQTISEDTYQAKKRASRLLIRLWAACPKVFLLCALFSNMTDLGRMRVDDCAETLENWWNGDSTHDSHQGLTETFDEAARRGLLPNQQSKLKQIPHRPWWFRLIGASGHVRTSATRFLSDLHIANTANVTPNQCQLRMRR